MKLEALPLTRPKSMSSEAYGDILRRFAKVFGNKEGEWVLDYLESHANKGFPNYNNVNETYSKIGEQKMITYIRALINNGKELDNVSKRIKRNKQHPKG